MPEEIVDLDPARIRTTIDYEIATKIYSTLVRYKTGSLGEIEPDLAEKWTISADAKVFTFFLRKGARWHKGYGEVTAEDVKYSFERHKDPALASVYRNEASIVEKIDVIGPYEVRITLTTPFPGFVEEFAAYRPGFIVNRRAIETLGNRYTAGPIGSGPFFLNRWRPGTPAVLQANTAYYGRKPRMQRAIYSFIKEDSLFEIALEKGDVDVGYVVDSDVQERLIKNPRVRTVLKAAPQTMYIAINNSVKPWDDARVRKALWYATDKQAVIDAVYRGLAQPSDTMFNPYVFGYYGKRAYTYDPARARQLLREAGYPDGFDTVIQVRPTQQEPKQATALQAIWARVGINATIEQVELATATQRFRQGRFQLATVAFMRVGPDQYATPLFHSGSIPFPNMARYANREVDAMIERARSEPDPQKRADLYRQIQLKAQEDAPYVPLYQPKLVLAMRPEIKGAVIPGLQITNLVDIWKEAR